MTYSNTATVKIAWTYQPARMWPATMGIEHMTITQTFESLYPLRGPNDYRAFYHVGLFGQERVFYGDSIWPSRSYWVIPGSRDMDD